MQLAGRKCKVCGNKIVFADEAQYCSHCDAVVHLACEEHICSVCGAELEIYARPKPDVLRDAILPRGLRPAKTGAAAFVIFFVVMFVLLMFYLISLA
jgi:hypothetical protein